VLICSERKVLLASCWCWFVLREKYYFGWWLISRENSAQCDEQRKKRKHKGKGNACITPNSKIKGRERNENQRRVACTLRQSIQTCTVATDTVWLCCFMFPTLSCALKQGEHKSGATGKR
jgi:hypothetical protein